MINRAILTHMCPDCQEQIGSDSCKLYCSTARIALKCKINDFTQRWIFLTQTFRPNPFHLIDASEQYNQTIQPMIDIYSKMGDFMLVPELTENNNIHYHAIMHVTNVSNYNTIYKMKKDFGFYYVKPVKDSLEDRKKTIKYMFKDVYNKQHYIRKDRGVMIDEKQLKQLSKLVNKSIDSLKPTKPKEVKPTETKEMKKQWEEYRRIIQEEENISQKIFEQGDKCKVDELNTPTVYEEVPSEATSVTIDKPNIEDESHHDNEDKSKDLKKRRSDRTLLKFYGH